MPHDLRGGLCGYAGAVATRTEYHETTGRDFLASARAHLAEGDLLQASEKGWGAAAQMVKAAAEARGWRHGSHGDLYRALNDLASEADDPHLRVLFNSASALHTNFYEGWMPHEMVAAGLSQVQQLLSKLDALAAQRRPTD